MSSKVILASKTLSISDITSSGSPSDSKDNGSVVKTSYNHFGRAAMPSNVRPDKLGGIVNPL